MDTRSVFKNAWRKPGMALTLMLVTALALQAAEVTVTVTGTLAGGKDYLGIFGMGQLLPGGTPFTLVYKFDDTKGRKIWQNNCPNGGNGILGSGAGSPATAELTIAGKSFVFGLRPNAEATAWRSLATRCSSSEIGFDITEGNRPLQSKIRVKLLPAGGKPLTADGDWRAPISLSQFYAPNGDNGFEISRPGNYNGGTESYLVVHSVTVEAH